MDATEACTAAKAAPRHVLPERRRAQPRREADRRADAAGPEEWIQAALLAHALDEIDLGMAVVAPDGRILHANQLAERELGPQQPLCRRGDRLHAASPHDQGELRRALDALGSGKRSLLHLGDDRRRTIVAVVPLPVAGGDPAALLVFQRRRPAEALTIAFYAREHGLTPAETVVLEALCNGRSPAEIAHETGAALSTVRTHISRIRDKTRAGCTRTLVLSVARLPPLTTAVKHARVH